MNIKFKYIKIDGFMSFDKSELNLEELGVSYVKGINNYESLSKSNGSGKSAIFESIIWCLTGSTSRGASDVCNSILGNGSLVSLEFSVDEIEYKVTRTKNHSMKGTSLSLIKNGEDISGNTFTKSKGILAEELGKLSNYDILTSIIILGQGLPNRLSMLKPASRKSRLEELSNTEEYIDDLSNRSSKVVKDLQSSCNSSNLEISKLQALIDSAINSIQSKTDELNKCKDSNITEEEYNNTCNQLSVINSKIEKFLPNFRYLNDQLSSSSKSYSSIEKDIKYLKNEIIESDKKLSSLSEEICPTCGQHIIDKDKINELSKNNKELVDKNTISIKSKLDELSELNDLISLLNEKVKKLQEYNSNLKSAKDELESKVNEYNKSKVSSDLITNDIESLKSSVLEYKNKLSSLKDGYNELIEVLDIASWIKSQLSRDFRTYILEGIVSYINSKCEEYSKYLFDTQGVVKLKIDRNNLDIYLGDRSFENLSGGEGRRVDIILQLVQRDLANNEAGFSSNLLVLDEILDNLDSSGMQSVLNLLISKSPYIDTMMIVSHNDNLAVPSDTTITVTKNTSQISSIEVT